MAYKVQAFLRKCWADAEDGPFTEEEWNTFVHAYSPTICRTRWGAKREYKKLVDSFAPGMAKITLEKIK